MDTESQESQPSNALSETEELNESNATVIIPEEFPPMRVDAAIVQFFDTIPSRSFASKLINNHLVKVNGKFVKASQHLRANDKIEIDFSTLQPNPSSPLAEKIPLDIIFEDEDILVINKPAGLVVHPGAGNPNGTLVNAVLGHCGHTLPSLGAEARAGIVHRLDRDTSGVMVVAKTQIALTKLSEQFASHKQERCYLALAQGVPNPPQGTIETWHGRDPHNRIRFAVQQTGQGKIAKLHYKVLEMFAGEKASLVRCELFTGRTHQIRVQMKHILCPLLGDTLYGGDGGALRTHHAQWHLFQKIATRQMLHAERLAFEHPSQGNWLSFSAPPPPDFSEALQTLRSWT